MKCDHCNSELAADATNCPSCGAPVTKCVQKNLCKIARALKEDAKRIPLLPREMRVFLNPVPDKIISVHAKTYATKLGLMTDEHVLFASDLRPSILFVGPFAKGFLITEEAFYGRLLRPNTFLKPEFFPPVNFRIPLEQIQSLMFKNGGGLNMEITIEINGEEKGDFNIPMTLGNFMSNFSNRETPVDLAVDYLNAVVGTKK